MLPVYVCLLFLVLLFFIYIWSQRKIKRQETMMDIEALTEYLKITNQDEDVWNISSRVNQQSSGSANNQSNWPTHNAHIPVESFALPSDYRFKDNRPPPPPYSEVGLPSYEQATGVNSPNAATVTVTNETAVTYVAPVTNEAAVALPPRAAPAEISCVSEIPVRSNPGPSS